MNPIPLHHWSVEKWNPTLFRRDFQFDPLIGGWRQNGSTFIPGLNWSVMETLHADAPADRLRGDLGQPGLWKTVTDGHRTRRLFEMPTSVLSEEQEDDFSGDEPKLVLDDAIAWAQSTEDGRVPEGWGPPPRKQIDAWIPRARLTVQSGSIVRQGELVYAPDCLALRMSITTLPEDLPEVNTRLLHQILLETTDHWRLVRVGITDEGGAPAVMAEVNFTGASAPVIERMISASLTSLHWATLWLAETAELLADVDVTPRALALCACSQPSNERKTP